VHHLSRTRAAQNTTDYPGQLRNSTSTGVSLVAIALFNRLVTSNAPFGSGRLSVPEWQSPCCSPQRNTGKVARQYAAVSES